MKQILLTYILILTSAIIHSQTGKQITNLEKKKKHFQLEIENFTDSMKRIDLQITRIKSKQLMDKIKDSSLTAIAVKGAKLKRAPSLMGEIIRSFKQNTKVIIIDYDDYYYSVCKDSLCGYMSEIWIKTNSSVSEYIKAKKTESKLSNSVNNNSSNYSPSYKRSKKNNSTYRKKRYTSYRSYIRGPRGGCYYINSNGNKTYVSRSMCN